MSLFGLRLGMELLGNMMLDIAIDIKNGKIGDSYGPKSQQQNQLN